MKYILLLLFLAMVPALASGQATVPSTCQLAVNRSPAVRGLKLGMSLNDVLRLFPGADQDEQVKFALNGRTGFPSFGLAQFYVQPRNYETKNQFLGIWGIRFVTIDDRVAEYDVEYGSPPEGPSWPRVEDWVAKFAETYDLPAITNWTTGQTTWDRTLKCVGFQVVASNLNQRGNIKVATLDPPYREQQKRREAFEEKLRREFKP